MGALCLDAKGQRVVLSPCPKHQPTTSTLQWRFIKARHGMKPFLLIIRIDVYGPSGLTQCVCFLLQLSGQLVHQQSQLCLEAVKEEGLPQSNQREVNNQTGGLFLRPCTHHPRQQWHFEQLVAPKGV